MLNVKFEEYRNDNDQRFYSKSFETWQDFVAYLFEYNYKFMQGHSYLPSEKSSSFVIDAGKTYCQFLTIHLIESCYGIEFSSGYYTNNMNHVSSFMTRMVEYIENENKKQEFIFVD